MSKRPKKSKLHRSNYIKRQSTDNYEKIVSLWMVQIERDIRNGVATVAELSNRRNPATLPAVEAVRRVQVSLLEHYSSELQSQSRSLTKIGCWRYLNQNLVEARKFDVEEDLRRLVFLNAAQFANPKMSRNTRVAGVQRDPYLESE